MYSIGTSVSIEMALLISHQVNDRYCMLYLLGCLKVLVTEQMLTKEGLKVFEQANLCTSLNYVRNILLLCMEF